MHRTIQEPYRCPDTLDMFGEGDIIFSPDVVMICECSVVGFMPVSDAAEAWFRDNVHAAPWQWLGTMLYVDLREAEALACAIVSDGLHLQDK